MTRRSAALALFVAALLGCGSGEQAATTTSVPDRSVAEVRAALDAGEPLLLLDVRSRAEYEQGHVPGALHVPHGDVAERLPELQERLDAPVVVYCERGGRARAAIEALRAAGVEEVSHMQGDIRAWRRAGLPIDR